MKNSILFFLILSSFAEIMCSREKKCTLTFINKSDQLIDSVVFEINAFKVELGETKPLETKSKSILINSIQTNNHDVTVLASIYSNGGLLKGGFYYNDLSGKIDDEYTLTLSADLKTLLN